MKKLLTALLLLSAVQLVSAQQTPTFEDMQRRLLQLQQQMMQELQNNSFGGSFFTIPGGDSTYTFRFDTTIVGDNFSGSFHFGPFGSDSTAQGDFFGSDWMTKFFGDDFRGTPPTGDSTDENNSEHLLPEERLRMEEEQGQSGKKSPENKKPAAPKDADKPKIKTVRI
ncbi:MAG: hypothetical protein JNM22_21055 [Saprospiraceae bacterium]|nr:hypothetical protein [Saprospiraceae bacterium]